MRIWNLFLTAALVFTVGFGAGYYAKTALYSNAESEHTPKEDGAKNIAQSAESLQNATVSPELLPTPHEANVSAEGEAYIQSDREDEKKRYLLKEHLGSIAVYKIYDGGNQMLIDIVDVGVELLPKNDRDMLAVGISVENEEEMLQLLEDYTS